MHIAIEGMDGVGKTTIAKALAKSLGMRYFSKSLHDMNDPSGKFDSFTTLRDLIPEEHVTSSFGFRGSFLLSRALQEDIVSDRFLASNFWAHTHGQHYNELQQLMEQMGAPDLTVILWAEPEIIRKRMIDRNPNDKDLVKLPHIEEAYKAMDWFCHRSGLPHIHFDTSSLGIEQVVRKLSSHITHGISPDKLYSEMSGSTKTKLYSDFSFILLDEGILKDCIPHKQHDSLQIPNGVEKLRPFSLSRCGKVREVILPTTIREVSSLAFAGLQELESIVVSTPNDIHSTNGVLYGRNTLIKYPPAKRDSVFRAESISSVEKFSFLNADNLHTIDFGAQTKLFGFASMFGCTSLNHIAFSPDLLAQCALLNSGEDLTLVLDKGGRYQVKQGCIIDQARGSIYKVLPQTTHIANSIDAVQLGPWAAAYLQSQTNFQIDAPIRRVGPYAFARTRFCSVYFPPSLQIVDDSIFLDSNEIQSITFSSVSPPSLTTSALAGINATITLPSGAKLNYAANPRWESLKATFQECDSPGN